MAKNRQIETRYWKDTYIKGLRPNEKYLYIYLLTNSFTSIAGIYELPIDEICSDTGLVDWQVRGILEKLEKEGKLVYKKNWIFIKNFIKYQSKNFSIIQGMLKEIEIVPKWFINEIKNEIELPEIKIDKPIKTRSARKYESNDIPYDRSKFNKEEAKKKLMEVKEKLKK